MKIKQYHGFIELLALSLQENLEKIDITISPSYGSIDIWVFAGDRRILNLSLENIYGLKIEKIHDKEILHILFNDSDSIETFYIETKPNIVVYGKHEISGNK
jgi:hypothetical protein